MSILIVLHEASRTGAPKIGGLIAASLKRDRDVRVVCLEGGPLLGWLEEKIGSANVRVIQFDGPRFRVPFNQRVEIAKSVIEQDASEIVYINSLSASEFIVAAKAAGRFAVLHLHEKAHEMRHLLAHHLTKLGIVSLCDAVVLAAEELKADLCEVFGVTPELLFNFGIAVDMKEIAELSRQDEVVAESASGDRFERGDRLVVGMVGHASKRKGCDIFFEAAKALPEHDFVWVGNWAPPEGIENIVFDQFVEAKLPNLFVSGSVSNPYQYISKFDLFFLSSREDPNPVVLAESLLLRVPILAFSKTTAVTDFLGRSAILCHGHTNLDDSVRVLKMLNTSNARSDEFRPVTEDYRQRFDILEKTAGLNDLFASLRA